VAVPALSPLGRICFATLAVFPPSTSKLADLQPAPVRRVPSAIHLHATSDNNTNIIIIADSPASSQLMVTRLASLIDPPRPLPLSRR
jgi:hypothetical protein